MYLVCLSQKVSQIWSCKFVAVLQPGKGVYMYSKYSMEWGPDHSMVWNGDQTTVWHGMGTNTMVLCLGEEASMFLATQTPYLCHSLSLGLCIFQLLVGSLIVSETPHPTIQQILHTNTFNTVRCVHV